MRYDAYSGKLGNVFPCQEYHIFSFIELIYHAKYRIKLYIKNNFLNVNNDYSLINIIFNNLTAFIVKYPFIYNISIT